MSKPHIKRAIYTTCYGDRIWVWGLWYSKDLYDSGCEFLVWAKDLHGLRKYYFISNGLL